MKIKKTLGMQDASAVKKIQSRIHYVLTRLRNGPSWVKSGHSAPSKNYRKQWDELSNAGAYLKKHETTYKSVNSIPTSPQKSEKKSKDRESVVEYLKNRLSVVSQPSQAIPHIQENSTPQKSQMMMFFESICPDVESLTKKQQMQFRINVMKLLSTDMFEEIE